MESNNKLYDEPSWSTKPIHEFHLEVLKDGSIIQKIPLIKSYTLLGRQSPDVIDILLEHPSISRLHAVLNFREDGALMLRDLNSVQGTFLNKTLCDRNIYYRVYVGDMIKFGQSTRKYILEGPEEHKPPEYNSINLEQYREKLILQSEKIKKIIQAEEECTWGFNHNDSDDYTSTNNTIDDMNNNKKKGIELPDYLKKDENYDRKYNDKYTADVKLNDIKNQKDQEIYDKIKKKELKIQNMQEEIRRIYMKESNQENGLTSGQLTTIQRNDEHILQLTEEIHQMIKQLKLKEQDRLQTNNYHLKRKSSNNDIDDDLIDITSNTIDIESNWRLRKKLNKNMNYNNQISNNSNESLSYQDIKIKLNKQIELMNESNNSIIKLEEQLKVYEDKVRLSKDNSYDQVQHVIDRNQYEEVQMKLKKALVEKNELIQIQNNLNQLLHLATPALLSLVQKTTINTTNNNNTNNNTARSNDTFATTLPQSQSTTTTTTTTNNNNSNNNSNSSDYDSNNNIKENQIINKEQSTNLPKIVVSEDNDEIEAIPLSKNNLEDLKRFIEQEKALESNVHDVTIPNNNKDKMNSNTTINNDRCISTTTTEHMLYKPTSHNNSNSITKVTATTTNSSNINSIPISTSKNHNSTTTNDHQLLSFNHNVLEGGDYNWLPPKQQTGDGKTKLNAKYGY